MTSREEHVAYMEELMPLIREALSNGTSVRIRPRGTSMLPMLREETDSVVLSPVDAPLKKYDLPLYCRDNGKYVLHRIIDVKDGYYVIRGDNTYVKEKVPDEWILGVMTEFYRGDKHIVANSKKYRAYVRFWKFIYPLRHAVRRMKEIGWGLLKRLHLAPKRSPYSNDY